MLKLTDIARYLCIGLFLISPSIQAQGEFASIRKNINVLANGLYHDLNKTKDSLVLKSSDPIFRVYTIGEFHGVIDKTVNRFEKAISLKQLKKGRYVFVVDQPKMKIVFEIRINRNSWLRNGVVSSVDQTKNDDPETESKKIEPNPESRKVRIASVQRSAEVEQIDGKSETKVVHVVPKKQRIVETKVAMQRTVRVKPTVSSSEPASFRPYNLTDMDRTGMQSRERARLERESTQSDKKRGTDPRSRRSPLYY